MIKVIKRDESLVDFDADKIKAAITKANKEQMKWMKVTSNRPLH